MYELTVGRVFPIVASKARMNFKLLFKTLLILAVLALLVLMGMHNQEKVTLTLPPVLPKVLKQPAAIMYFGFFGVGFLVGTIMMAGSSKRGGSKTNKVEK